MSECSHAKKERKTADIVTRNVKIVHKIYRKVETLIKASSRELDHHNLHPTLLVVMRELNKTGLNGFQKKELGVMIMTLLLDSVGLPHIVSSYSASIIADMIEFAYVNGLHRYKRPHRWRFWK